MPGSMLRLEAGGTVIEVLPHAGAAILRLDHEDRPLLAPARGDVARDPTTAACFPMVPWCNRLSAGGVAGPEGLLRIAPNWPTTPFPVHGHGWLARWDVQEAGTGHVRLRHVRDGPGHAYVATLDVILRDGGARLTLGVLNEGPAQPFGIGLHPYLSREPGTRLRLPGRTAVRFDRQGLPLREEPALGSLDFTAPRALGTGTVSALWLDAVEAELTGTGPAVRLLASGALRHLQVWAPEGRGFVCIEPLSHPVDAFSRRASAARHDLAPGASLEGTLDVAVSDGAPSTPA